MELPENSKEPLEIVSDAVDELYKFRDHYFQTHEVANASNKENDVKLQLETIIPILDEHKDWCEKHCRARYYYLRGKALNILPKCDPAAMEHLTKAVKLDFKLTEAWNELGECNWKKRDMEAAKRCYEGALKQKVNKVSLRNLSMVLRQLGNTNEERQNNIKESVDKAKEAVQLDIADGTSWLILGNAYLTSFFTLGQNPDLLKKCIAAYQQAEKDVVAQGNSDLYYNRGIAQKYEEEYMSCLENFNKSKLLDPNWTEPQEKLLALQQYLQKVHSLIQSKGQIKGKKLQNLAQSITGECLGPYKGGKYTNKLSKSILLEEVPFDRLKPGINLEKVVVGKVVCSVSSDDPVPFTFCLVDKDLTCFSVTVYNLAQGQGVIINDSVAIPEPFIQEVKLQYDSVNVDYMNIRVDSPLVLVVNGKKFGKDKQAFAQIAVKAYND